MSLNTHITESCRAHQSIVAHIRTRHVHIWMRQAVRECVTWRGRVWYCFCPHSLARRVACRGIIVRLKRGCHMNSDSLCIVCDDSSSLKRPKGPISFVPDTIIRKKRYTQPKKLFQIKNLISRAMTCTWQALNHSRSLSNMRITLVRSSGRAATSLVMCWS